MTTADKLTSVFAPKLTIEDHIAKRIAARLRSLSPSRREQAVKQLEFILKDLNE